MLKLVKEKPSGLKEYSFDGVFQFNTPDLSDLEWGDSIVDNSGKGMIKYVNQCSYCGEKGLRGTLVLVPIYCSLQCRENARRYGSELDMLISDLRWVIHNQPHIANKYNLEELLDELG